MALSIKSLSVCNGVGTATSLQKQELSLDSVAQKSSSSIVVTTRNPETQEMHVFLKAGLHNIVKN